MSTGAHRCAVWGAFGCYKATARGHVAEDVQIKRSSKGSIDSTTPFAVDIYTTIEQLPSTPDTMCYTVVVAKTRFQEDHPFQEEAQLCWRLCSTRARQAYRNHDWNWTCDDRELGTRIWITDGATTIANTKRCDICAAMAVDHEVRGLEVKVEQARDYLKDLVKEERARQKDVNDLLSSNVSKKDQRYLKASDALVDARENRRITNRELKKDQKTIKSLQKDIIRAQISAFYVENIHQWAGSFFYLRSPTSAAEEDARGTAEDYPEHFPPWTGSKIDENDVLQQHFPPGKKLDEHGILEIEHAAEPAAESATEKDTEDDTEEGTEDDPGDDRGNDTDTHDEEGTEYDTEDDDGDDASSQHSQDIIPSLGEPGPSRTAGRYQNASYPPPKKVLPFNQPERKRRGDRR